MNSINRVLAWAAIAVVALVAVSLIYIAVASWRAGARFERHIAAIREAGDPVTLADLAREPIPPKENAAVFLRRAEKSLAAAGQEFLPLYEHQADHYRSGRLTESGADIVKSALEAYPDILPLIEQAAACGDYDRQYDYSLPPVQFSGILLSQSNRQTARFLARRVELQLFQDDREGALRTCLLMLRLGRHFDREPMFTGHLISLAVRDMAISATSRVLTDGPVSSDLRRQLENELAGHDGLAAYRRALTTERVFGIESFRELLGGSARSFFLWYFKRDQCDYLQQIDREIELGSLPPHELGPESDAEARATNVGRITALAIPSLVDHREAFQRVRARLQCLRVLNAVQAYVETTDVPEPSLADLKLADELTVDPYDGRPLRMKKTPAGWTIYSVGKNGKDDGGKFDNAADIGVGQGNRTWIPQ